MIHRESWYRESLEKERSELERAFQRDPVQNIVPYLQEKIRSGEEIDWEMIRRLPRNQWKNLLPVMDYIESHAGPGDYRLLDFIWTYNIEISGEGVYNERLPNLSKAAFDASDEFEKYLTPMDVSWFSVTYEGREPLPENRTSWEWRQWDGDTEGAFLGWARPSNEFPEGDPHTEGTAVRLELSQLMKELTEDDWQYDSSRNLWDLHAILNQKDRTPELEDYLTVDTMKILRSGRDQEIIRRWVGK